MKNNINESTPYNQLKARKGEGKFFKIINKIK